MDCRRRTQCNFTIMQQIGELKNWHKQQQQIIQPKVETNSDKENQHLLPVDTKNVCGLTDTHKKQGQIRFENKLVEAIQCDPVAVKQKDCVNFDELPIHPKKADFDKLVENSMKTSKLCNTSSIQTTKHKFLKRGEGTARFGMVPPKPYKTYSVSDIKENPVTKPQNFNKNQDLKYISDTPYAESYTTNKVGFENHKSSIESPKSQDQAKAEGPSWKTVFTTVSQSPKPSDEFQLNVSTDSVMLSFIEKILSLDEASKKECEELKIFELLEQRALDSSFSSNSSIFTRLMENSVKSTPVKYKPDTISGNTECVSILSKNTVNTNVCTLSGNKSSFELENSGGIKTQDEEPNNSLPSENNGEMEKSLHVHFAENDTYRSFEIEKYDSKEYNEIQVCATECRRQNSDSFDDCEEWSGGDCIFENDTEYSSSEEDCRPVSPPSPVQHSSDKSSNANRKTAPGNVVKVEEYNTSDYGGYCVTNSNIINKKNINPGNNIHATEVKTVDASIKTDVIRRSVIESRLQELESEIETFRSENNKLRKLRSEYDQEYKKFQNEKKEFLKHLNEEKSKIAADLEESKRKLAKEKLVYEKYSKTVNKNASKQERVEILSLKQKLIELQEEMKKKESRWSVSQARVRNQMRQLEEDNKRLKDEVERIKKMSACNHQVSSHRIQENPVSNTQLIHIINKQLSNLGFKYILPDCEEDSLNYTKQIKKFGGRKFVGHNTNMEELRTVHKGFTKLDISDGSQQKGRDNGINSVDESDTVKKTVYTATFKQTCDSENSILSADKHVVTDKIFKNVPDEFLKDVCGENEENATNSERVKEILIPDEEKALKEIIFPDGRKEVYYPNGNTKKISPSGDITKIIYFNGDVKETNEDGTVKYYYAESRVWHTTYPDGLEVLDFPTGLVEQRCKNGTVNITYPNGSKKCTYPDSSEEWIYPDGSTMKIDLNNDKILTLPNGQKEFHTKEHMRREYPDGTIKFVYPDGTQETRYSNGRIRLKDKSGNLVMDSG